MKIFIFNEIQRLVLLNVFTSKYLIVLIVQKTVIMYLLGNNTLPFYESNLFKPNAIVQDKRCTLIITNKVVCCSKKPPMIWNNRWWRGNQIASLVAHCDDSIFLGSKGGDWRQYNKVEFSCIIYGRTFL